MHACGGGRRFRGADESLHALNAELSKCVNQPRPVQICCVDLKREGAFQANSTNIMWCFDMGALSRARQLSKALRHGS